MDASHRAPLTSDVLISDGELAALLLGALFILLSQRRSQWQPLLTTALYQRLLLGSALCLVPLWLLRAGLHDGLTVHFLGITPLTLLLGWRLALVAATLPLLMLCGFAIDNGSLLGSTLLFTILLPVLVSEGVRMASRYWLTRHLFVYVFVVAFLGGALTMAVHVLTTAGWMLWQEHYSWQIVSDHYLAILPLLLFPEALLSGMSTTLLVVYRPHWVATFYEREYLEP